MGEQVEPADGASRWKLSLDTWAVLAAFLVALLIRAGVIKHIAW